MGRRFQNYVKPSQITFTVGDKCYLLKIEKDNFTKESLDQLEEISNLIETDQPMKKRRRGRSTTNKVPQNPVGVFINKQTNNETNIFDLSSDNEFGLTPNIEGNILNEEIGNIEFETYEEDHDFIWSNLSGLTFEEEQTLWGF